MEGIAPPLKCLLEVKMCIKNGQSLRIALANYVKGSSGGEFERCVQRLLIFHEQGKNSFSEHKDLRSQYRRVLLEVFNHGLRGEPIMSRLEELEEELSQACIEELDAFVRALPLRAMIPVLLLQFPAFLLLLLGPTMRQYMSLLNA